VHAAVTTALRNLFALSAGVVLVAGAAPEGHPARSRLAAAVLGWPGWAPVAACSYALNMFHFRVVMELALGRLLPLQPGSWASTAVLYASALGVAVPLAHAFTRHAEPPMRAALERALLGAGAGKDRPKVA